MRVHQCQRLGQDVDHHGHAARAQHTAHFAQRGLYILPVVGAVARRHQVQTLVGQRQLLGAALQGTQTVQALGRRRRADHGQHLGGWVGRDHAVHAAREQKAQMPAAAAQIQRAGAGRQTGLHPFAGPHQIRPLGMNAAVQIGLGLGAELVSNRLLMVAHGSTPLEKGWRWRDDKRLSILVQDCHLYWYKN